MQLLSRPQLHKAGTQEEEGRGCFECQGSINGKNANVRAKTRRSVGGGRSSGSGGVRSFAGPQIKAGGHTHVSRVEVDRVSADIIELSKRDDMFGLFQSLKRTKRGAAVVPDGGDGKRMYVRLSDAFARLQSGVQQDSDDESDDVRLRIAEFLLPIHQRLVEACGALFPLLRLNDPSVLVSERGSRHQDPHTDLPNLERCIGALRGADDDMPLSGLLALQADTTLLLWENSHRTVWDVVRDPCTSRQPARLLRVVVPKGHVIVFRGDLVHAQVHEPLHSFE